MYRKLIAYSATSLAIIGAALLLALITTACATRYASDEGTMTLSSGLDKKSSRAHAVTEGGIATSGSMCGMLVPFQE